MHDHDCISTPCGDGYGNCNSNDECNTGLICWVREGDQKRFGYDITFLDHGVNICVQSGTWEYEDWGECVVGTDSCAGTQSRNIACHPDLCIDSEKESAIQACGLCGNWIAQTWSECEYKEDTNEDDCLGFHTREITCDAAMCIGSEQPETEEDCNPCIQLVYSCKTPNMIDLDVEVSPYNSDTLTTNGAQNTITLSCGGNANEKVFHKTVQPGEEINIHQSENNFDSRHELRWGGYCPGENVVRCIDDPDSEIIAWVNNGIVAESVFFIVDSYSTVTGTFTVEWSIEEVVLLRNTQSCQNLIDLDMETSPVQSNTLTESGATNDIDLSCGGEGNERIFRITIPKDSSLEIHQSLNSYDSRHSLRVGGQCPGDNVMQCVDDPDYAKIFYTNQDSQDIFAYFIVDAYKAGSGEVEVSWTLTQDVSVGNYQLFMSSSSLKQNMISIMIFSASAMCLIYGIYRFKQRKLSEQGFRLLLDEDEI